MSFIEDLGREAMLQALTQPRLELQTMSEYDSAGNSRSYQATVPVDSLITEVLRNVFNNNKELKKELLDLAVIHLKKNPQIIAEKLAEKTIEFFTGAERNRYDRSSGNEELVKAVREAAGYVLKGDTTFKEKVLDMAHLSDGDHISVTVELKPKGQ